MKVNILGTEYTIEVKKYDDEPEFDRRSINGFCDGYAKRIVVCDMHTFKGWENEREETITENHKVTLRHEIVHAFLNESGLMDNSLVSNDGWAKNEEMVDWIAIQFPKIYKAFGEAGCI